MESPPVARKVSPNRPQRKLLWACVLTTLMSSIYLFALDNTIVANIQPSIIKSLGDVELLPWVSVSYPLGVVSFYLLQSNFFMLFDNKVLYINGIVLFEIGSAICGASPNMPALIAGRVICGLGGCSIYVGALNLLSIMTTEAERPTYFGLLGITWGLGTITGPVIGGAFTESPATWRWCFYINLVVGAVMAPVYLFLLPAQDAPVPGSLWSRLRSIDWIGAIINSGSSVSLIMAISFGGGLYRWGSGQIIALFATSGVLWVAFFVQQRLSLFTNDESRIFPVKYLKSRDLVLLFVTIMCAAAVVYIPLYFVPLYFQFVWNAGPLKSAVHLLPLVSFQVFGTIASGALTNPVGYYFPWYLIGGTLSLIGGVLLHLVTLDTHANAIYGYSVLIGLGSGLYAQTGYAIAQLLVPAAEIPKIVAFIGYAHIMGISLSLTIGGSVFLNQATNMIAQILPSTPRALVQHAITGVFGGFFSTVPPEKRHSVLNAITMTISNVYYIAIFAGAFTIILSLFMKREKLNVGPQVSVDNLADDAVEEKVDHHPAK